MFKSESDADGVRVDIQAESTRQIMDELLALFISLEEDGFDSAIILAIIAYKRYLIRKEHVDANHKDTK